MPDQQKIAIHADESLVRASVRVLPSDAPSDKPSIKSFPYKRQLTDKYSAEKLNGGKILACNSKGDSVDQKYARPSIPSNFSQIANTNQARTSGILQLRRSGTMKESKDNFYQDSTD